MKFSTATVCWVLAVLSAFFTGINIGLSYRTKPEVKKITKFVGLLERAETEVSPGLPSHSLENFQEDLCDLCFDDKFASAIAYILDVDIAQQIEHDQGSYYIAVRDNDSSEPYLPETNSSYDRSRDFIAPGGISPSWKIVTLIFARKFNRQVDKYHVGGSLGE